MQTILNTPMTPMGVEHRLSATEALIHTLRELATAAVNHEHASAWLFSAQCAAQRLAWGLELDPWVWGIYTDLLTLDASVSGPGRWCGLSDDVLFSALDQAQRLYLALTAHDNLRLLGWTEL